MAKHGKKFTAAAAQVEDRPYTHRRGDSPDSEGEIRQVRRDGGAGDAARRRSEARGPDGPRHGRPSARPRQEQARAGDCRRRQAEGSDRRRRRLRRRRRDRREDPRRLDRLRRRGGDARHDARRRTPRQGARPARPDAEPEDRHRDAERRAGDQGDQGRQGGVPRRQDRHHPRAGRQDVVPDREPRRRTRTRSSTASSRRSRRRPRASTSSQSPCPPRWGRASRSTPRTSTSGRSSTRGRRWLSPERKRNRSSRT